MQQADELAPLIQDLRTALPALSLGMFTGYSEKELESGRYFTRHGVDQDRRRAFWRSIRGQLDFAVMGRYNRLQPSDAPMRDFGAQTVEIIIAADGLARTTGFPTLGNPA
jgi:anaerobic ribonucleoside-triphosphate reductase activating protein